MAASRHQQARDALPPPVGGTPPRGAARRGHRACRREGTAAATHRAVAARADLLRSTTTYFFESVNCPLEAATRRFAERRVGEPEEAARALPVKASADEVADLLATAALGGDRSSELVQVEANLHAARASDIHGALSSSLQAFESVAETALRIAGASPLEQRCRALVALADGFLLQHLARPRADDHRVLREALRSLFIAYSMVATEQVVWDDRPASFQAECVR